MERRKHFSGRSFGVLKCFFKASQGFGMSVVVLVEMN